MLRTGIVILLLKSKGVLKTVTSNFEIPVIKIATIQDFSQYNQAVDAMM
jgi:hypothetical protein